MRDLSADARWYGRSRGDSRMTRRHSLPSAMNVMACIQDRECSVFQSKTLFLWQVLVRYSDIQYSPMHSTGSYFGVCSPCIRCHCADVESAVDGLVWRNRGKDGSGAMYFEVNGTDWMFASHSIHLGIIAALQRSFLSWHVIFPGFRIILEQRYLAVCSDYIQGLFADIESVVDGLTWR